MNLFDNIESIKGIGEKTAKYFHKLQIYTVKDLLMHFPREYEEWKECIYISELKQHVIGAVKGTIIESPKTIHVRKLSITSTVIKDSSGTIQIQFYNMPYMKNSLIPGAVYIFRGVPVVKGNRLILEHPKLYKEDEYRKHLDTMQPVYPATKGLTQTMLVKALRQAIPCVNLFTDYLPKYIRDEYQLEDYGSALQTLHFPLDKKSLIRARERFVFEEFFFFLLSVMVLKKWNDKQNSDYPYEMTDTANRLIQSLPYKLTNAQLHVWKEIQEDLISNHLMNRLIQGDVGSGKTIVAILTILECVANQRQAAFMAPTEVLARQHYETIMKMKEQYDLCMEPVLLIGSMTAKEKREAYAQIQSGEKNLIIGTSALIQDKVEYHNLSLVITDEQHRFGVRQREMLAQKGNQVHVCVMSATPIPRTLALILYGDLDISIMNEMPAERLAIKNCVVDTGYRQKAYQFMQKQILEGHQVYVICPMVEAAEEQTEDLENVIDYAEHLKSVFPANIRIGYLHGQMKAKEKNEIMETFSEGNLDILVSTTVIEVGINVPNATVMMVENAERFGLAQLHQLRGRVGRGKSQSYCIFVSSHTDEKTMERLKVLNQSNDGFFISSEDMRLRGPGDLFGIRQSGEFHFKLGDIYQDAEILKNAQKCASQVFEDYHERNDDRLHELWNYFDHNYADNIDFIGI